MNAITYYFSMFSQSRYSGLKLHRTGVDAVNHIKSDARSIFELPVIAKDSMKLTRKNRVTIGFPHRHLVARFLTEDELKIYAEYGEACLFDFEDERLCPPETKKTSEDGNPN